MLYFSEIICLCVEIRKSIHYSLSEKILVYDNMDNDIFEENIGLLIQNKLGGFLMSSFYDNCIIKYHEFIINISWTTKIYDNDNYTTTFIINI